MYLYGMSHREYHRKRRARLKAAGLCLSCGREAAAGRTSCGPCGEAISAQKARALIKRREVGLCIHCSRPALTGLTSCRHCWFRNTAINHFRSRSYGDQLEEIWERQKGKCVYTGETLVPGANASLDHINPVDGCWDRKSRLAATDGVKSLHGVVQWVTKTVNVSKNKMSHADFVRLCKKIAGRF